MFGSVDTYQLGEKIVGSAMKEVHLLHRFEKQVLSDGGPDGFRQRRRGALLLKAVRLELELHVGQHLFMDLGRQSVPSCEVCHCLHRITLPQSNT